MKVLFYLSFSFSMSQGLIKRGELGYNFGVVKMTKDSQIYRSSLLGEDGLQKVFNHLKKNNLPLPKTIISMNDDGYKGDFKYGDKAKEEYLLQKKYNYRFYHAYDYSYRTYVDGSNPFKPKDDIDLKSNLDNEALKWFGPDPKDGKDGGIEAVERILKLIEDPANQPVLFHCTGGVHRTGMIAMILRYKEGGYWLKKSSNFFKRFDFSFYDPFKVLKAKNNAQAEYLKYAHSLARKNNLDFIDEYSKKILKQ